MARLSLVRDRVRNPPCSDLDLPTISGENLSEKEILISARALKELKDHKVALPQVRAPVADPHLVGQDFAECQFPERKPGADDNVIDALGCGWHAMLGTVKLSHPIVCAPFDDTTYIGAWCMRAPPPRCRFQGAGVAARVLCQATACGYWLCARPRRRTRRTLSSRLTLCT